MKVNITTRHFNKRRFSNQIREYSLKKIRRLERYVDSQRDPSDINLIISEEKLGYLAEINVNTGHLRATATVENNDMHAAVDKVFDAIVKQLRRRLDKQITSKRRSSSKITVLDSNTNSKRIENNKIRKQKLQSKPMSLEEAILQLNVVDDNFLIFRNSDTLEMNVLYKNSNSNIVNLVTP